MIDRKELDARIAEIQYSRDQSPDDCIYLASLYTIRDHLFPTEDRSATKGYSLAAAPAPVAVPAFTVTVSGDSDFLKAVSGKNGDEAWNVIDGLMDTLKSVNPRVYDSIMRKIRAL